MPERCRWLLEGWGLAVPVLGCQRAEGAEAARGPAGASTRFCILGSPSEQSRSALQRNITAADTAGCANRDSSRPREPNGQRPKMTPQVLQEGSPSRLARKPLAGGAECRGRQAALINLTFEAPPPRGAIADAPASRYTPANAATAAVLGRHAEGASWSHTTDTPAGRCATCRCRPSQRWARPQARGGRPATPPPVVGRQHGDCQTDAAILEALAFPAETIAGTQTDATPATQAPRPPAQPLGQDHASTQVNPAELFDFERDAGPMVQVLVQQALDAAAVEAAEGLRLEALRRRRRELEQVWHLNAAPPALARGSNAWALAHGLPSLACTTSSPLLWSAFWHPSHLKLQFSCMFHPLCTKCDSLATSLPLPPHPVGSVPGGSGPTAAGA